MGITDDSGFLPISQYSARAEQEDSGVGGIPTGWIMDNESGGGSFNGIARFRGACATPCTLPTYIDN
jgi:hypothetical protein